MSWMTHLLQLGYCYKQYSGAINVVIILRYFNCVLAGESLTQASVQNVKPTLL